MCQTVIRSYRVSYSELYEHIPWLTNTAEGLVTLTNTDEVGITMMFADRGLLARYIQEFRMVSEHSTCLLPAGLWCLRSKALNTFSQRGVDTSMQEVSH